MDKYKPEVMAIIRKLRMMSLWMLDDLRESLLEEIKVSEHDNRIEKIQILDALDDLRQKKREKFLKG